MPDVRVIAPEQPLRNFSARAIAVADGEQTCLSVDWDACYNELTGIDHYELRITGRANASTGARLLPLVPGPDDAPGPAAFEVLPWQDQGLRLTAEGVCTNFTPGMSLYAEVRCVTGSGLSNQSTSPSAVFDRTPPTAVAAGFGPDAARQALWTSSVSELTVFWQLADPDTRLASVLWAIGTACGSGAALELPRTPRLSRRSLTSRP